MHCQASKIQVCRGHQGKANCIKLIISITVPVYLYLPSIHHKHIKGVTISCGENMCFTDVKPNIRQQSRHLKETNIHQKKSCSPMPITLNYRMKLCLHKGKPQFPPSSSYVKIHSSFLVYNPHHKLVSTILPNVFRLSKNA